MNESLIRISIALLAIAAVVFSAWLLAEDHPAPDNGGSIRGNSSVTSATKTHAIPPIDLALPKKIETATFAMG